MRCRQHLMEKRDFECPAEPQTALHFKGTGSRQGACFENKVFDPDRPPEET
jgi:hypothetical protein